MRVLGFNHELQEIHPVLGRSRGRDVGGEEANLVQHKSFAETPAPLTAHSFSA